MSHFYGIVRGQAKTEATRTGSKNSGLGMTAASRQGAVTVELREVDGKDWVMICLTPWQGQGMHKVLYAGRIDGRTSEEDEEATTQTEEYRRTGGRMKG